jgi:hypothetical protein
MRKAALRASALPAPARRATAYVSPIDATEASDSASAGSQAVRANVRVSAGRPASPRPAAWMAAKGTPAIKNPT